MLDTDTLLGIDRDHIWHPYGSIRPGAPVYPVRAARGVRLQLADGRELIDGMASWWSAIHGYNHPVLNTALQEQTAQMAHVMFGGLTHEPAARLAKLLVDLTPAGLNRVFLADSGSVAVEVALKMALQYWRDTRPGKHRILALRGGYHGDTFGAMATCDPVTGMHHLFRDNLPQHLFAPRPQARFDETPDAGELATLRQLFIRHHHELAALILEPVVQGTGGMWFYSPACLRELRALCDEFEVLLIADEIATGFGRSGRMFACEHAGISPDILCLGKALTGGYMTLAATLCSDAVAEGICSGEAGVFMHGPTFMGNPLACAVACASIGLLVSQPWARNIRRIEARLAQGLAAARELPAVADVRVLGAIGVIELRQPVDMASFQPRLVNEGIWVRPFGRLVYVMPPYIMEDVDLDALSAGMLRAVASLQS